MGTKHALVRLVAIAGIGVACSANRSTHPPSAPMDPQTMRLAILEQERIAFEAVYRCDLETAKHILVPDLEFVHDQAGLLFTSRKQFLAAARERCPEPGSPPNVRREAIEDTIEIYPLDGYGAVHQGSHRFFDIENGKERLSEVAKFVNLWRWDGERWTLARVISYDHREPE